MKHLSPLRYPGGKASLSKFLMDVIDLNDLRGGEYFEPYAGGAGAALSLLQNQTVSAIHINDIDPRIYAFWQSAVYDSERFVETIFTTPLTIDEWQRQKEICIRPNGRCIFELGFAAFFMNRCNRSGVIVGAGPIGGLKQAGHWTLDVRFNREDLAQRILELKEYDTAIRITNLDAVDFLKSHLPRGLGRAKVFVYLDPPYVEKGNRLYHNAYRELDHAYIAKYLRNQNILPWIMSYDDTSLIRNLYRDRVIKPLPIRYSLQAKRTASELIIAPNSLTLPYSMRHQIAI